ncbi:MAG: hypothetical protein KGQ94_03540, partial [Alphaproteobacteria bacterium]|nr:hypothetical protein [Alphaproteobacteria bacterium]
MRYQYQPGYLIHGRHSETRFRNAGRTRQGDLMNRFSDARFSDVWAREILLAVFHAAVKSADPFTTLAAHLPQKPKGRCVVVGAG